MANVEDKIRKIRSAVYGREVRGSIADSIEAINDECSIARRDSTQAASKVSEYEVILNGTRFDEYVRTINDYMASSEGTVISGKVNQLEIDMTNTDTWLTSTNERLDQTNSRLDQTNTRLTQAEADTDDLISVTQSLEQTIAGVRADLTAKEVQNLIVWNDCVSVGLSKLVFTETAIASFLGQFKAKQPLSANKEYRLGHIRISSNGKDKLPTAQHPLWGNCWFCESNLRGRVSAAVQEDEQLGTDFISYISIRPTKNIPVDSFFILQGIWLMGSPIQ